MRVQQMSEQETEPLSERQPLIARKNPSGAPPDGESSTGALLVRFRVSEA